MKNIKEVPQKERTVFIAEVIIETFEKDYYDHTCIDIYRTTTEKNTTERKLIEKVWQGNIIVQFQVRKGKNKIFLVGNNYKEYMDTL